MKGMGFLLFLCRVVFFVSERSCHDKQAAEKLRKGVQRTDFVLGVRILYLFEG